MAGRALLIASHFPPMRGSSGVQRTLKFCRYLLDHDWQSSVLTVHPRAHPAVGHDQMDEIPPQVTVKWAFALDTARHLSLAGRYPAFLAWPDRWASWWLGGVVSGLALIRRQRPDLIWSTFPIATSHLIGLTLSRITGLPWIADFRDSMTEPGFPADARTRRVYCWIERQTVARAAHSVFTTPGTMRMYAERYPALDPARWLCIPNGYDEENFVAAEALAQRMPAGGAQVHLVHSGLLYPSERDPTAFFAALAELRDEGIVSRDTLRVTLRATGHDAVHRELIARYGVGELVALQPNVAYTRALAEMLRADGLLIFQAANCNHQVPAKVYEYMRARRPVFALTAAAGDTARVLRDAGIDSIVELDDQDDIKRGMRRFLAGVAQGTAPLAGEEAVRSASRRAGAARLAAVMDRLKAAAAG